MLNGIEDLQANWNGQMMPLSQVRISPLDRGWLFGDAMYEVIRVIHGKPWLAEEHIDRLCVGLQDLRIVGISKEDLQTRLVDLIEGAKCLHGFVYMHVTRGVAPRRHLPFEDMVPNCLLYIQSFADIDPLAMKRSQGLSMMTTEDPRWKRTDLKTTNLLGSVMAGMDAARSGVDDAIFINADGYVTETTHSNIFFVRHGRVITPPCDGILNGVTRSYVIELLESKGIPVHEEKVSETDLEQMDEIFLTATMAGIMPVVAVNGRSIRSGRPGLMTTSLTNWLLKERAALKDPSGEKNTVKESQKMPKKSWLVSSNQDHV
ncbi:MAG: aminotransferase class IV [Oligoflexales bacterium]